MRDRGLDTDPAGLKPPAGGRSARAPRNALLALQRRAGNARTADLVEQARGGVLQRRRKGGPDAGSIEFVVGDDLPEDLVRLARELASGGIGAKDLARLRWRALHDETMDEYERMFLAGLLDPANARRLRRLKVRRGAKLSFSLASIQRGMATVTGLARPAVPRGMEQAALGAEHGLGEAAFTTGHAADEIRRHAGPGLRARAEAVIRYASGGAALSGVLTAMLRAASDATPSDMLAAATVYAIAAVDGNPLAHDLRAGRLKVDAVPEAALGNGTFAAYQAFPADGRKGDTIYVPLGLDIRSLHHRSAVVHELQHAQDDKAAAGRRAVVVAEAELRGWRAGAAYKLKSLAAIRDPQKRRREIARVAPHTSWLELTLMVPEARGDKDRTALVYELNAAVARHGKAWRTEDLDEDFARSAREFERYALGMVEFHQKLAPGTTDELEGLSGETRADTLRRAR